MADTSKLIRYFEASGSGEEARRMLDLAEQVVKGRPYRVADFTSPAGLVIADAIKANYPQLIVKTDGGYEGAERIRIAFVDSDFNGTVDMGIRALKVNWDPRFRLLTHRDVLGSLMGLGIDRSKFGDVIVQQGGAQILVDESVADFVIQNFTKIAMVSVSVEAIDLSDIAPKEDVSRTKLVSAINAGLLQVNWQPAKGASQEVKEGDVISMRGRGRMKVEAITGTSRKGRIGVYLKRFM
ncbi:MAG: YlmH/Sll1252 family protein [Veillonella sp.]|nr:YlmH/Sll1252 family protein [Veillonella sp.]